MTSFSPESKTPVAVAAAGAAPAAPARLKPTVSASMLVRKRDGRVEKVHPEKIYLRLAALTYQLNITDVDLREISNKVEEALCDGISTVELDEVSAEIAAGMTTRHPDFGVLAARIAISNLHKQTRKHKDFCDTMTLLYEYVEPKTGEKAPLIAEDVYQFIKANRHAIANRIVYSRDYNMEYFGFKTLERSYLLKVGDRIVERPATMWMRTACGIHCGDLDAAFETYDLMSQGWFTHASPTLFNSGTPNPQLSSCFLLQMQDDSIEGIYNTLKQCAMISKYAGGIGLSVHNIRATGSYIRGTNGTSNGLVPMLRNFNSTARYVDQGGGKRKGAFAVYLETWHADIEAFLDLRKNSGAEEQRCRDLFTGLWIPDLFMERIEADGEWSLFCPKEAPGLPDVWGPAFNALYTRYEREGRARKVMKARDLWRAICDAQSETGTPYLLFKDACNRKSNQQHLGTIKSSNLCVAGETMILTRKGYFPIGSLEGQKVRVWNGDKWSKVKIVKTGENKPLVKVTLSNGTFVECTPYHKFILAADGRQKQPPIKDSKRVDASELKVGSRLIKFGLPPRARKGDEKENITYPYTHGLFCADGTYEKRYNQTRGEWLDPKIALYGPKKDLISHLDVRKSTGNEDCMGGVTVYLPEDLAPKFKVPINGTVANKLRWLEGYLDGDGCVARMGNNEALQAASINFQFLRDVQLMLQTLGVHAKINKHSPAHRQRFPDHKGGFTESDCKESRMLRVNSGELCKLIQLGFSPKRLQVSGRKPQRDAQHFVKVVSVVDEKRMADTFCFEEKDNHAGVFNGNLLGNCTEIIEYTSKDESAVCNLASINLRKFVEGGKFNHNKLAEVTQIVTRNLDRVISINHYPTPETRRSNMRHRPIGIGVQGLANAFIKLRLPFTSPEARQLNKDAFETMYFAAMTASKNLAKQRYMDLCAKAGVTVDAKTGLADPSDPRAPKKYAGAYETFVGSPLSQGKFQFDLWHDHFVGSGRWDWEALRAEILLYGARNSLLLAPMPTASTSQILGSNECFEPYTSNLGVRRTLAGEFICVQSSLVEALIERKLWSPALKDKIVAHNGSIQAIEEIPQDLKDLYKTVWEISQRDIIDMAADRGQFICQSQSLNIHMANVTYAKLCSMHFHAWKKGLKTGCYYLRTKAAVDAVKVTLPAAVVAAAASASTAVSPAVPLAGTVPPAMPAPVAPAVLSVPTAEASPKAQGLPPRAPVPASYQPQLRVHIPSSSSVVDRQTPTSNGSSSSNGSSAARTPSPEASPSLTEHAERAEAERKRAKAREEALLCSILNKDACVSCGS